MDKKIQDQEHKHGSARRRILFIAEGVTLAHVARTSVLARSLDPTCYEVHVAWDPRYNALLGELPFPFHPIRSLSTREFVSRVARGAPMHDTQTLRDYVKEDIAIINKVSPDVVVGDFRLSLAVSARISGIPHVALANAYWSPYARQEFLLPEYDYPMESLIGAKLARSISGVSRVIGFAMHTRPLNKVLREYKLPGIGRDIRDMYTYGDHTAYCDIPQLVPTFELPLNHHYIGAVLWSPTVERPSWWDDLPHHQPIVYATPGSSGEGELLPVVLEALSELPVTVIAATAGRTRIPNPPPNARVVDFIDGVEAAARSQLVICNGGSPTTYQGLTGGVPVLGISSNNLDQHLNMEAVRRFGAGEVLRARGVTAIAIRSTVTKMLKDQSYAEAAKRIATAHLACNAQTRFRELIDKMFLMKSTEATIGSTQ